MLHVENEVDCFLDASKLSDSTCELSSCWKSLFSADPSPTTSNQWIHQLCRTVTAGNSITTIGECNLFMYFP